MTFGQGDISLWLFELKQKNINEFKYKDLPKELQIKKMLLKARISGLITKINKSNKCVITWRITKEGDSVAALYGKREYDNKIFEKVSTPSDQPN